MVKHLTMTQALALKDHAIAACVVYPGEVIEGMPVSYTHLTLPTIYSV